MGKTYNIFKQNELAEGDIILQSNIWGCSSVGRAPALQAGGHGFESHHLHHRIRMRTQKEGQPERSEDFIRKDFITK